MKQTNSRAFRDALKSMHETYGFMLQRGYEIFSTDDYDMGWQVVLRKQDLYARIIRSRGEEEIYFRTSTQSPDEFIDIGSVIYAATGDKVPRWESSEPKVIERYLDRIETYFEGEYVKNKDSLRTAQREYYAAFSQTGVVSPSEGKPIPHSGVVVPPERKAPSILYYPLMGIIILLILGGVITLCMVLLDRLFSLF